MAAGQIDFTRRDVHYSKKDAFRCKSGYHNNQDCNVKHNNGCSFSEAVGGRDVNRQGRRFASGTSGYELGELSDQSKSSNAFAQTSMAGNYEISKPKDEVSMPMEKKRKYSPVFGHTEDKRLIYSERVTKETALPCSMPSLPESFMKVSNVYSITAIKLQGFHALPTKSHEAAGPVGNYESRHLIGLLSSLPQEQGRSNDEEVIQVEDEHPKVHQISTSRWASFEEDSLGETCYEDRDIPGRRVVQQVDFLNSPESGELCEEILNPTRRGGNSDSEGSTDVFLQNGKMHDEIAGVSHNSDLEDDKDSSGFLEPAAPKARDGNMPRGCRSVFEYEKLSRINEGTYGVVYKARDKKTDQVVALKKVKMETKGDGFPLSSLREISILLSLHHPSLVDFKEVVMDSHQDVFIVMDYMEHDLKGLMGTMKQPFSEKEVKCLMLQLLEGVKYLHDNWVLHRDLKTSNILLNNSGKLKICDFGMSRQYGSPLRTYTPLVVTLWYRAPELLLGAKPYSTAVDMWSVGCIMAELLAKHPLFNGKTELDQLDKIFRIIGVPNETNWPGFSELPGAKVKFVNQLRNTLRETFPAISFKGSPVLSERGFDLLSRLLTCDPEQRITAEAALKHSWFHVESAHERRSVQESLARRLKSMTTYC
ncbi:cyclin-dependent kinase G-2-like isoform X2 [Diospyros lotus]|uniref:cyclin-dependent kinase G-2-like isoform X2 n=1 Tax=Diospyros lotus TaxID=55363 RepID=UPI00225C04F6|nr:cyclin-dependent kinase G-2-like isoform X2 [Diospyros lotus]